MTEPPVTPQRALRMLTEHLLETGLVDTALAEMLEHELAWLRRRTAVTLVELPSWMRQAPDRGARW